jgi:hypothetical protein
LRVKKPWAIRSFSGDPSKEERSGAGLSDVFIPGALSRLRMVVEQSDEVNRLNSFRFEGISMGSRISHAKDFEKCSHLIESGKPLDVSANLVLQGS